MIFNTKASGYDIWEENFKKKLGPGTCTTGKVLHFRAIWTTKSATFAFAVNKWEDLPNLTEGLSSSHPPRGEGERP